MQIKTTAIPQRMSTATAQPITPFLKWAGGKAGLLPQLEAHFPRQLLQGRCGSYIEPFVGAGAVFLHVAQRYHIRRALLIDSNRDLLLCWRMLKAQPETLIDALAALRAEYLRLDSRGRERMFYAVREAFNACRDTVDVDTDTASPEATQRAAQLIFLNKTCFNGLFRLNAAGAFNVPCGRYENPSIYDAGNLRGISRLLRQADIECGDFTGCASRVRASTFVYFDPPYRPLSKTASFTAYSRGGFNDDEQRRLAAFFRQLNRSGASLMLSNADPMAASPGDRFFEELYAGFKLHRVHAARCINSDAAKRGKIKELVIKNYGASGF